MRIKELSYVSNPEEWISNKLMYVSITKPSSQNIVIVKTEFDHKISKHAVLDTTLIMQLSSSVY